MHFLFILSHYVKSYGHFLSNFGHFTMPVQQILSSHVTQEANLEKILFCPNSTFDISGISKFPVERLSTTSEVIRQKPRRGWKTPPPPVHLGFFLQVFPCYAETVCSKLVKLSDF